jgi:hypothetical protein
LKKAAAKNAAWGKARRFDRRNPNVSRVSFRQRTRVSRKRVVCGFTATGSSPGLITTCYLKVKVVGEGSVILATGVSARCGSESVITYEEALEAFQEKGDDLAEQATRVFGLARLSQKVYEGSARWSRTTPAKETCTMEMTARLIGANSVTVRTWPVECEAVLPSP